MKADFRYLDNVWYIRPDETVTTIIINGINVAYMHYKDGCYSYFTDLESLNKFLDGDTKARFFCSDDMDTFENISILFN